MYAVVVSILQYDQYMIHDPEISQFKRASTSDDRPENPPKRTDGVSSVWGAEPGNPYRWVTG